MQDSEARSKDKARQNKRALLNALGKYGITNDRIDEITNYYRYVRSRGEMWLTQPAAGYAVVENGKVTRFVITASGSGCTVPPTVSVTGMPNVVATVKIGFSTKSGTQNGSVTSIALGDDKPADSAKAGRS